MRLFDRHAAVIKLSDALAEGGGKSAPGRADTSLWRARSAPEGDTRASSACSASSWLPSLVFPRVRVRLLALGVHEGTLARLGVGRVPLHEQLAETTDGARRPICRGVRTATSCPQPSADTRPATCSPPPPPPSSASPAPSSPPSSVAEPTPPRRCPARPGPVERSPSQDRSTTAPVSGHTCGETEVAANVACAADDSSHNATQPPGSPSPPGCCFQPRCSARRSGARDPRTGR